MERVIFPKKYKKFSEEAALKTLRVEILAANREYRREIVKKDGRRRVIGAEEEGKRR